jgi:hypothetical protein
MNQVFFVTFYFSIYHSTISRFFLFVGNPVLRVLSNYSRKAARYVASNTSRSFGKLVRIIIVGHLDKIEKQQFDRFIFSPGNVTRQNCRCILRGAPPAKQ